MTNKEQIQIDIAVAFDFVEQFHCFDDAKSVAFVDLFANIDKRCGARGG